MRAQVFAILTMLIGIAWIIFVTTEFFPSDLIVGSEPVTWLAIIFYLLGISPGVLVFFLGKQLYSTPNAEASIGVLAAWCAFLWIFATSTLLAWIQAYDGYFLLANIIGAIATFTFVKPWFLKFFNLRPTLPVPHPGKTRAGILGWTMALGLQSLSRGFDSSTWILLLSIPLGFATFYLALFLFKKLEENPGNLLNNSPLKLR